MPKYNDNDYRAGGMPFGSQFEHRTINRKGYDFPFHLYRKYDIDQEEAKFIRDVGLLAADGKITHTTRDGKDHQQALLWVMGTDPEEVQMVIDRMERKHQQPKSVYSPAPKKKKSRKMSVPGNGTITIPDPFK